MAAPAFVRLAAHPVRWELLTALAGSDLRVRELVERVDQPQSLVSYHLRLLRDAGLVASTRSSFDGRDSYYHLDLERCAEALTESGAALHPALRLDRPPPSLPVRGRPVAVLFVCTGNSARSPIAEALLRHHGADHTTVSSAGTRPRDRMHRHAVRVLRDTIGIDISQQRPQHLDTVIGRRFDHVITLCDRAREAAPDFARHPRRAHWSVVDPATADDGYRAFRRVAADIDSRIRHLLPVITATDRSEGPAVTAPDQYASVRYLVTDVQAAIDFYTTHLGFALNTSAAPAFADVVRGPLRLLLSGPASSGARATPGDAATPGHNRIHLVVDDLDAEIVRIREARLPLRSDLVTGPGGRQILIADPDGNLVELFQAAPRS